MRTKKVGSTGRFGAKYGLKIRRRVLDIEKVSKAYQACPVCLTGGVKRLSKGIFKCNKCGSKVTGRAYTVK